MLKKTVAIMTRNDDDSIWDSKCGLMFCDTDFVNYAGFGPGASRAELTVSGLPFEGSHPMWIPDLLEQPPVVRCLPRVR